MFVCARVRAGVCALEKSAPSQEQHTTLPADGTFGCMSAPGSWFAVCAGLAVCVRVRARTRMPAYGRRHMQRGLLPVCVRVGVHARV